MLTDKYIQELDTNFNSFKIQQNINILNRIKFNRAIIDKLTLQNLELHKMLGETNKFSLVKGVYTFTFSNIDEFKKQLSRIYIEDMCINIPGIGYLWIEHSRLAGSEKSTVHDSVPFINAFSYIPNPVNQGNCYVEITDKIELYINIDVENKKAILLSRNTDINIPITNIPSMCILTANINDEHIYECEIECEHITCYICTRNPVLNPMDKCVCKYQYPTVTSLVKFKYTVNLLTYEIKFYCEVYPLTECRYAELLHDGSICLHKI
jgi:hypothetical protein